MKIVIEASARSAGEDTQTVVHESSLETGQQTSSELSALDLDMAFRLDVKRFPTAGGSLGHQLMLVAVEVNPRIKRAGIEVRHLIDLGVLNFTTRDPEPDEDVICRVEGKKDLWATRESVEQVWGALSREIKRYLPVRIEPPHVVEPRPLKVAIAGMKYFNDFVSPDIRKIAPIYFTVQGGGKTAGGGPHPDPPRLFR